MGTETRAKVTLRANPQLMAMIREMGQAMGISPAGIVDRLLLEGLERFSRGEIDFTEHLVATGRGRYCWVVEIEPDGLGERVRQRLTIT